MIPFSAEKSIIDLEIYLTYCVIWFIKQSMIPWEITSAYLKSSMVKAQSLMVEMQINQRYFVASATPQLYYQECVCFRVQQ